MWKGAHHISRIGQQGAEVEVRAPEFRPDFNSLLVLLRGSLHLSSCHQQIAEEVMRFRTARIGLQLRLDLALRLLEAAYPRQGERVVVSRRRVVGFDAQRGLEMVARLLKAPRS